MEFKFKLGFLWWQSACALIHSSLLGMAVGQISSFPHLSREGRRRRASELQRAASSWARARCCQSCLRSPPGTLPSPPNPTACAAQIFEEQLLECLGSTLSPWLPELALCSPTGEPPAALWAWRVFSSVPHTLAPGLRSYTLSLECLPPAPCLPCLWKSRPPAPGAPPSGPRGLLAETFRALCAKHGSNRFASLA